MNKIKSIKKQGKDTVEVITATREYYFQIDRKEKTIMTSIFDNKVKDNDLAMKEGFTNDFETFRTNFNRRLGKDVVDKVMKRLK